MVGKIDAIYLKSPVWTQQIMTAAFGIYWYHRRYGSVFHDFVGQLQSQEHLSAEEYRCYQEQRLKYILSIAQESPYYREIFLNHGVESSAPPFKTLKKLPILTKNILRQHSTELLTKLPLPRNSSLFQSSGTTGTPTNIYHTCEMLQKGQGWIEARVRNWVGLNFRSRRVMFGSRKICRFEQDSAPFWRVSPAENMAYMSIYHLSPSFIPSYLSFLRRYKPQLIMGYPSALFAVARYAIDTNNFPAPAQAVITTSEAVTPIIKDALETAWKCKVFGTYGSVEHCVFASQCEHGNYHLSPEVGILEVIDLNGKPCPPGKPGKAICTGLHNDLQPLIRYEIGDIVTLSKDSNCPCGRTLPILEAIDGRLESMCYMPDGRMTLRFDTVFKGVNNVWEAQVIQEKLDLFLILVVPGEGFNQNDINHLIENMKLHVGNVQVEVQTVEKIDRTENGKFQSVICNLKSDEIAQIR